MTKKYNIFFRRNNKERYWEVEKNQSLTQFKWLLENILESSTEKKLEIKVILEEEPNITDSLSNKAPLL